MTRLTVTCLLADDVSMLPDDVEDGQLTVNNGIHAEDSLSTGGLHEDDSLTLGDISAVGNDKDSVTTSPTNGRGQERKRPAAIDTSDEDNSSKATSSHGGKRRGSVLLLDAFSKGAKILPSPSPEARRRMTSLITAPGALPGAFHLNLFQKKQEHDLGEIEPYMPAIRFRERMDRRYDNAKRRKGEVSELVSNAGHIKVAFNVEVTR